ncbi:MAG: DUF3347 domain-containing protein [Balneolales bacterium]
MKFTFQLSLFIVSLFMIACSGEEQTEPAQPDRQNLDPVYETPAEFKSQLSLALDEYFGLKDALVNSNAGQAAAFAQAFGENLHDVPGENLSDEAGSVWSGSRDILYDQSRQISQLNNVTEQRKAFDSLSTALIQSMEAFGPFENAIYQQTCPMAGDGSADWLSLSGDIENPYYGAEMLNCGAIVRTW